MPPARRPSPAFPLHALRPVALACAGTLLAGAAAAQDAEPTATATLAPVRVTARADGPDALPAVAPGGKTAQGARLGVLGNTDLMDTPFSITPLTAEAVADRQAQTVGAALRGDPSIRMTTNEGHIVENFQIRGFSVNSSSMAINGLYGLAPEQHTPTELFERIEVLKGPGAMMTGLPPSGDVGGVVNLVTKRAGDVATRRVTGSLYGKGNLTAHADLGTRFGEDRRLGVRVNAVLADGRTWLDHQTKSREVGHLAMDYRGRGWTAEVDAYAVRTRTRKGSPMQPILNGWRTVPEAPEGHVNFFYGEDVHGETRTVGLIGRVTQALSDRWSVSLAAGTARHRYDGFIFGTRPVFPAANAANGNATGTAYHSWGEGRTATGELALRGQFHTGPVRHRVTAAATLSDQEGGSRANGTAPIDSNLYQPVPITMPAAAAAATYAPTSDNAGQALSLADTLSFSDDRVQLTLGARLQRIEQKLDGYDERAVTPLVGLVVKPWGDALALYGNYVEGLSAGTTVAAPYLNEGTRFEPFRSKQGELGVKWATGEVLHTLALFQITRPALVDVNVPGGQVRTLDGEQRNRGVEWNVTGRVLPALTLLGGVAYTKAEQTKTQGQVNQGKGQFGVPEWTANLAADWAVPAVPALVLTGQVNHTGAQWLSGDNQVEVPAWTTFDAGARYALAVGEQRLVLRALVTNLADKAYFESVWGAGRVNVGAPRALHLSVSVDL